MKIQASKMAQQVNVRTMQAWWHKLDPGTQSGRKEPTTESILWPPYYALVHTCVSAPLPQYTNENKQKTEHKENQTVQK